MGEIYNLEDVFKLNGVPDVTFVRPVEFPRLLVALRTHGRGVVIEGPSGIGKTSAVTKALEELGFEADVLTLSARKKADLELISELPEIDAAGLVVIDDFHRLDPKIKLRIADYLKVLADEERADTKIVIIGINRAGESLISFAPDLSGRIEIIKFEVNPDDRVEELIHKGCQALRVEFSFKKELVQSADGSFNIAQMLCHDACLAGGVTSTQADFFPLSASFELIRERVLDRLNTSFYRRAETFAKGKKLRREGRAPYLQILKWLSESEEWTIDMDRELSKRPSLRGSVGQVVEKGHLANLLNEIDSIRDLLHYDSEARVLAVEDPKFFFFIRNLSWNKFAERLGYLDVTFSSRYDFALSFAGSDRDVAQLLFDALSDMEFEVFYDAHEQDRILAANVEEYLAPIYKSEATYVVAILGKDYPDRVWTKFESQQFRTRFGENAVVPVWFTDAEYGVFDASRSYGGEVIDRDQPLGPQIARIATLLAAKVKEHRIQGSSGSTEAEQLSLPDSEEGV
ncbi:MULTISPECIES: TIR domain-containing protein [unclassified Streptomyces]|uniref:TIR domain-containing protein n=1 Tax=unclassified Streptomyces TaxID=2593676 RepID=UPI003702F052